MGTALEQDMSWISANKTKLTRTVLVFYLAIKGVLPVVQCKQDGAL